MPVLFNTALLPRLRSACVIINGVSVNGAEKLCIKKLLKVCTQDLLQESLNPVLLELFVLCTN